MQDFRKNSHIVVGKVEEDRIGFLSEDKINNNNNNSNYGNDYTTASRNDLSSLVNPLAEPLPVYYEFYKRLKLFPWWLQYSLIIIELM
jgi:hypothetical protein